MTYIEKPEYYFRNRVFVVSDVREDVVTGHYYYLDTWKRNATQMRQDKFLMRFEFCDVQIE